MELKKTQVDLSGLLDVLGKNLYSTPTVAIRELVQNAHDSCVRRELEDPSGFEASIVVTGRPAEGKLIIEDTGAGLTKEEIERYLATVGAGYTRRLRGEHADPRLIGQFGLGFLTAFIVSDRVDVFSTSYQSPGEGWHFSSKTGESYTLSEIPPRVVGTRIELTLSANFAPLATEITASAILQHYCALLPVPLYADEARTKRINSAVPPWRLAGAEISQLRMKRLRLDFAQRFEPFFEPLCAFPLELDGEVKARGTLWIQDGSTYATSDNRHVSVFVRSMLVTRDARELLPTWAGFVGAVVESEDLRPTASREDLQEDEAYRRVQLECREVLTRGLGEVAKNDPAVWRRILARHNEALLGAALSDPRLFEILASDLKLPTSEGEMTVPGILERSRGKLHVSMGDKGSHEETLFRALGVPVVNGTRYAALPFSLRWGEVRRVPVIRLGTDEGNRAVFAEATLPPEHQQLLESLLLREGQALKPSRFKPASLPLILIPDREVELKERIESDEADRRIGAAILGLARMYTREVEDAVRATLYVNLDAPVIQDLLAAPEPARSHGARLLAALAQLLATHGEEGESGDLSATLESFSEALRGLLSADTPRG